MKNSKESSTKPLRGIAALFDDFERKELFRKYLFFLGWVEIFILAFCWLYQLGDGVHDGTGTVERTFPWRLYFLVSFLAPVAITFLIGVIIVGFNKYFAEEEVVEEMVLKRKGPAPEGAEATEAGEAVADGPPAGTDGKIYKLTRLVHWVRQLPFLALLLLLGVGTVFFYNLDSLLGFLTSVGEKSVKALFISAAVLLGVASLFVLVLIILNYRLRKKSMEYQYRSTMADRFGLIILEDNTVLNSEGKLLIQGKKLKDAIPLLPAEVPAGEPGSGAREETRDESPAASSSMGPLPRTADAETT